MGPEQRATGGDGRVAYLDGLRAIAALAVLVHHLYILLYPNAPATGPGAVDPVIALACKMCAHGVDLFFVLSGFCLAYPTLARVRIGSGMHFDINTFWAKRIVRIIPPFWFNIVVSAAILVPLGLASSASVAPASLLHQALFLDANAHFVNAAFWTLPIEFRWYALFPFALLLYVRAPRAFAAAIVATFAIEYGTRAANVDLGMLPLFLAGIWAADVHVRDARLGGYALAAGVPALVVATLLEPPIGKQFYGSEPVGMLAMVCFVLAAGSVAPLRALLSWRPLATVGTMSYSLYLINGPVVILCSHFHQAWPTALLASLFASAVFYALCERPFVSGPLRDHAVAGCTRAIEGITRWLRLPHVLTALPGEAGEVERLWDPARPVTRRIWRSAQGEEG